MEKLPALSRLRMAVILAVITTVIILLIAILFSHAFPNERTGDVMQCTPARAPITASSDNPLAGEQVGAFFSTLFTTQHWPERWKCGTWTSFQGWFYILSDVVIFLSYFGIPIFLVMFVARGRVVNFPFRGLIGLFSLFILFCGITHLIDAIIFWLPIYNVSAFVKSLTAGISFATLVAVVMASPKLLTLRGPEDLKKEIDRKTKELSETNARLEEEVNRRRDSEQKLKQSLELNEKLFMELHHRVKNNLQMISSLVYMKSSGDQLAQGMKDMSTRISSMAKVHELLLTPQSIDAIELSDHIRQLVENLKIPEHVAVNITSGNTIYLSPEEILNVGSIMVEVLNNCKKYAFKAVDHGTLDIDITQNDEGVIHLTISDNGPGFDPDQRRKGSVGFKIMESFARFLNGQLETTSDKGTTVRLKFIPKTHQNK